MEGYLFLFLFLFLAFLKDKKLTFLVLGRYEKESGLEKDRREKRTWGGDF